MAPTDASASTPGFGPWRREVWAFLELLALTGIVFVQPTLDVLSKNATIFATSDRTPLEVVSFVVVLVVVPPLIGWMVEVLVGMVRARARRVVHVGLMAGLIGVLAVEVLARNTELSRSVMVVLAVPVAIIAVVAVARLEAVRLWLRFLSLATPVFVIVFLGFSPVNDAVFAGRPRHGRRGAHR